jgi:hypothetical protein
VQHVISDHSSMPITYIMSVQSLHILDYGVVQHISAILLSRDNGSCFLPE